MTVQREYLSPNEIAEVLGVSPFTIRRYIKLGELRAVKLLGGFRVHREELQRFLKAHEVNPSEERLEPAEQAAVTEAQPAEPVSAHGQAVPDREPPAPRPARPARRVMSGRKTRRRTGRARRSAKSHGRPG